MRGGWIQDVFYEKRIRQRKIRDKNKAKQNDYSTIKKYSMVRNFYFSLVINIWN